MKYVIARRVIEFDYTEGYDEYSRDRVNDGEDPLDADDLENMATNDFMEDVAEVDMTPQVIVSDEPVHIFEVWIKGCTAEQAAEVMRERLGHDEDYGFPYTLQF